MTRSGHLGQNTTGRADVALSAARLLAVILPGLLSLGFGLVAYRIFRRYVLCAYVCDDSALRDWLMSDIGESWILAVFFSGLSAVMLFVAVSLYAKLISGRRRSRRLR